MDVTFGEGVMVIEPANLYGCTIGSGSFVGPFVEIQRRVVIGARCRIVRASPEAPILACLPRLIGDARERLEERDLREGERRTVHQIH